MMHKQSIIAKAMSTIMGLMAFLVQFTISLNSSGVIKGIRFFKA